MKRPGCDCLLLDCDMKFLEERSQLQYCVHVRHAAAAHITAAAAAR